MVVMKAAEPGRHTRRTHDGRHNVRSRPTSGDKTIVRSMIGTRSGPMKLGLIRKYSFPHGLERGRIRNRGPHPAAIFGET
jgi:hypothetical protein